MKNKLYKKLEDNIDQLCIRRKNTKTQKDGICVFAIDRSNKIIQWKIYPGKPQMNAICERFNRTVKEECLTPYLSLLHYDKKTFLRKLCDWLYWYNAERSHHSLGYNRSTLRNTKILICYAIIQLLIIGNVL